MQAWLGAQMADKITTELKNTLASIKNGPVEAPVEVREVEQCLFEIWDHLIGSNEEGTTGDKICGRTEDMIWEPPELKFTIERHGGTVLGSSRASLHFWSVNVDIGSAEIVRKSYRQLSSRPPRLNVAPIAAEIAALMLNDTDDERLKWSDDRNFVTVQIGKVIPDNGYAQTIQGRRNRFRIALETEINPKGWKIAVGKRPNTYTRMQEN